MSCVTKARIVHRPGSIAGSSGICRGRVQSANSMEQTLHWTLQQTGSITHSYTDSSHAMRIPPPATPHAELQPADQHQLQRVRRAWCSVQHTQPCSAHNNEITPTHQANAAWSNNTFFVMIDVKSHPCMAATPPAHGPTPPAGPPCRKKGRICACPAPNTVHVAALSSRTARVGEIMYTKGQLL